MRTLIDRAAFDFDELRFDWGDVVLAAIGWGEWQRLERSLAEGLVCASQAQDRGEQVGAELLRVSVVTFRRTRGLLAGEDYLRWLTERALSPDDVHAHFGRAVLHERLGHQRPSQEVDAGQLAEAIRAEAILSGRLHMWAERLARCAAAARGLTEVAGTIPTAAGDAVARLVEAAAGCRASALEEARARDRAWRVAGLQAAERAFADRVVTCAAIERCLAEHRLGWQRFAWVQLTFADEGAAREAALWVREDGMSLDEVATLAHVAPEKRVAYADDVSDLAGLLAAAAPGALLGPLTSDNSWRLVRMCERTPPTSDDVVLHERASAELMEDALARYLAGRVSWRGQH